MQYLRARYYDVKSGRFASVDPFEGYQELPISKHRYIYGNNSPTNYIDPSGQYSLLEKVAAFAITTFLIGLGQRIGGSLALTQSDINNPITFWDVATTSVGFATPVAYGGTVEVSTISSTNMSGKEVSQDFFALVASYGASIEFKGSKRIEDGTIGGAQAALPSIFGHNPSWFSGSYTGLGGAIIAGGGWDVGFGYIGYGVTWDFPALTPDEKGLAIGGDAFSGIIVPISWVRETPGKKTPALSKSAPAYVMNALSGRRA